MQYNIRDYNKEQHDKYKALLIPQPYAEMYINLNGDPVYGKDNYGIYSILIRQRPTNYRGDLLICSSPSSEFPNHYCGFTLGFVELYHVKAVKDMKPEEWVNTGKTEAEMENYSHCYAFYFKNPRRVIEFPASGTRGIFTLVYTKDIITCYPINYRLPSLTKALKGE